MRIGICAGEQSGDVLGADLMSALKAIYPYATFEGVGGEHMTKLGCKNIFPMDVLSVMGVAEVLPKLPRILAGRRKLLQHFKNNPPDVFIGIDAPDFNLPVERILKKRGVKTVHYVSPTIWAWREKRVFTVKKAVDLMLCVLPFEIDFYKKHDVNAVFVGHPAAKKVDALPSADALKIRFKLDDSKRIVTLMPGSRQMEIKQLGLTCLQTAQTLFDDDKNLMFVLPAAKPGFKEQLENLYSAHNMNFPLEIIEGHSLEAMKVADLILATSGTTTLEACLLDKPMVVVYKMHPFNWWLAQKLVNIKAIALPNLLAGEKIVPEYLQEDATPAALADAMLEWLNKRDKVQALRAQYATIREQLTKPSGELAANAIKNLLS